MKKIGVIVLVIVSGMLGMVNAAAPMRSMTLGGATGLIVVPSARTGWETGDFGFNLGYHYVSDYDGTHLPKLGFYLFDKWEIGGTVDTQEEDGTQANNSFISESPGTVDTQEEDGTDILFHTKFRFYPWSKSQGGGSALAIGANYQSLEPWDQDLVQGYFAVTYDGQLFGSHSETSFAVGKTFATEGDANSDVDFGMGFSVAFLPSILKGYVNWVTDFGNFGYSGNAYGANAIYRGVFNTGFRIAPINRGNIHLKIDVLFLDLMDDNRSFGGGFVFGMVF